MKLGVHAGLWMAKWTDEITPILKIIADTGFDGVAALSALSYLHNEGMAANTDITAVFYPQNNQGSNFSNANISAVSMTVIDGAQQTRATGNLADGFTGDFKLITSGTGYKLQTTVNTFIYSNYLIKYQYKKFLIVSTR